MSSSAVCAIVTPEIRFLILQIQEKALAIVSGDLPDCNPGDTLSHSQYVIRRSPSRSFSADRFLRCIEMRIFRISRTDRVVDSVVDFRPPEISRARFLIRIIQGFPANVVVCVQIQSVTFTSQSRLQTTRDFVSAFSRSYHNIQEKSL